MAAATAVKAKPPAQKPKKPAAKKKPAKAKPKPKPKVQTKPLPKPNKERNKQADRKSMMLGGPSVQKSSFISSPGDASEREADRVASAVMSSGQGSAVLVGTGPMQVQRKETGATVGPAANDNVEARIKAAAVGGKPLSKKTRALLEPRFGADFSSVRVHDDGQAAKLSNRIGARAFTYGKHIFFNEGQYQPDSPAGQMLLAHELTHTIQQRETVQRKAQGPVNGARVGERTDKQASRLGISDALDFFADAAYHIPGFRMFTILIGFNPINMREVEASAANILRAIVEFLPGGRIITTVLDHWNVFDTAGTWVEQQMATLGISGTSIRNSINEFLDSLSWSDIFDLDGVWERAKSIFTTPIDNIITFIGGLWDKIVEFVQQAVLAPLAALVSETEGYGLLQQILGYDPITGETVERSAEAIIGGLLKLIGQEELWNNIQEANALERIWQWFQGASESLVALVMGIPDRFVEALQGIEFTEFLDLPAAVVKVLGVFGGIVVDFGAWVLNTVLTLMEIIIDVVAPNLMGYLRKAGDAFMTIINDPVRFGTTLIGAAKMGFNMFVTNFVENLKQALLQWLTGALGGASIYIPQALTVKELLKFALSVLGVTWAKMRAKLVKVMGEPAVAALETGFELVKTLITEGPAAAWEQIVESIGNLQEMIIEKIVSYVSKTIVGQAVIKLLSMLNPIGALIQTIIAIYDTIMFFVERAQQIASVAAVFIDSMAEIASGKMEPAAKKVESTLVGILGLAISFLARLLGLGGISKAIGELLEKIRKPVDKAIDKLIAWIVKQAKKLGAAAKKGAAAVVNWWKEKLGFTNKDGERHTLQFMGQGEGAKLAIATTLMTVESYLNGFSDDVKATDDWKKAKTVVDDASKVIFTPAKKTTAEANRRKKIKAELARISAAFARLGGGAPTNADYGKNTKPTTGNPAKVDVIWKKPLVGSKTGAWPKTASPWKEIYEAGLTKDTNKWVQMHIVSEKLGGSGSDFGNLIPAPNSINTGPFRTWELSTVSLAKQKQQDVYNRVWVEVSVAGSKTAPTSISGKSGLYFWKGKAASEKWLKNDAPQFTASANIPAPRLTGTRKLSLNFSSGTEMRRHFSVPSSVATLIKQGRPYADLAAFSTSMTDRGATAAQIRAVLAKGAVLNE